MDFHRSLRRTCVATTCLLLSVLIARAQTDEKRYAEGRIVGTVLDRNGEPLQHICVQAVLDKTGMYMPTAETDAGGRFVVEGLEPGAYHLFGESDADGYPNTALSFFGKEEPLGVVIGNGGTVPVVLVLGPQAGVLSGTVTDMATGKAIVSRHSLRFIIRNASSPGDSIEFDGPAKFRWLIPPGSRSRWT